jgi:hypothetical protein
MFLDTSRTWCGRRVGQVLLTHPGEEPTCQKCLAQSNFYTEMGMTEERWNMHTTDLGNGWRVHHNGTDFAGEVQITGGPNSIGMADPDTVELPFEVILRITLTYLQNRAVERLESASWDQLEKIFRASALIKQL